MLLSCLICQQIWKNTQSTLRHIIKDLSSKKRRDIFKKLSPIGRRDPYKELASSSSTQRFENIDVTTLFFGGEGGHSLNDVPLGEAHYPAL